MSKLLGVEQLEDRSNPDGGLVAIADSPPPFLNSTGTLFIFAPEDGMEVYYNYTFAGGFGDQPLETFVHVRIVQHPLDPNNRKISDYYYNKSECQLLVFNGSDANDLVENNTNIVEWDNMGGGVDTVTTGTANANKVICGDGKDYINVYGGFTEVYANGDGGQDEIRLGKQVKNCDIHIDSGDYVLSFDVSNNVTTY